LQLLIVSIGQIRQHLNGFTQLATEKESKFNARITRTIFNSKAKNLARLFKNDLRSKKWRLFNLLITQPSSAQQAPSFASRDQGIFSGMG
jgi:hypothetical protein